jgi:predicted carbohydrate-binding protein with CBM5 and CBM33 domain
MSDHEPFHGLPSFDANPALQAFSNASALKAVKLGLLNVEPVGWTPQALEAFEMAAAPQALARDKELAAARSGCRARLARLPSRRWRA